MDQYHLSSNEMTDKKSLVYTNSEINEITKLDLNLISYIYCFPKSLVDGVPHDIKTENNHCLNSSDKVVEASERMGSGDVIPHFCCGYFKRLSSDFFLEQKRTNYFLYMKLL